MRRISLSTILLAATVLLTSEGCGGSNGGGGNPPGNPFAGTYQGAANLDNGKVGTIGFEIEEDGSATGFLSVPVPTGIPTRAADGFPPSTYDISGTVNGDGEVTMNGDVDGSSPFTVNVGLEQGDPGPFPLTISLGAQTFLGTAQPQSDGAEASVTLTLISPGNAHLDQFSAGPLLVEVNDDGEYDDFVMTESAGMFTDSRTFLIEIPDTMQPGQVQVITSNLQQPMIMYSEFTWDNPVVKSWTATSGSYTLVARNGNKITLMLTDVVIAPTPIGGNNGTGSFKASGIIHN